MLTDLLKHEFIFFDNAIGWLLLKSGLKAGERPDIMNVTAPDIVENLQRQAAEAGSDVLCTNTFGANAKTLKGSGFSVEQIITAAVGITKKAGNGKTLTALDIGPIGEFIKPFGTLSFDESYALYREQAIAGEAAGADLIAIETMSDLLEVKAVILAVKENTNLPVFAMMTFDKSGRTFTGCRPESFAIMAEGLGASAVGINCSLSPGEIFLIAEKLVSSTSLPVIIKPNAGLPNSVTDGYDIDAAEFARQMAPFASLGVKILGGCCGSTAEYIKALRRVFKPLKSAHRHTNTDVRICSPLQIELIDSLRLDKTPDLSASSPEDIIETALEQADAGFKILTVNLTDGLTIAQASEIIKNIQSQSVKPLHLVSNDIDILSVSLREIIGTAAVGCPSCSKEKLYEVASKYGAAVV